MSDRNIHSLTALIAEHKKGRPVGIYSICSSNVFVLRAAIMKARRDGTPVLIESTSNQVNQFGGYTGMTPDRFAGFTGEIAGKAGLSGDRIILGGDHLGPNAWQGEDSRTALSRARDLVHAYVTAGFTKIHIDVSMPCADDEQPLSDEVIAVRSADLCEVAEHAARKQPSGVSAPVYVIGTEVPVPGGAREDVGGLAVTRPEDVDRVIELTRDAFNDRGLEEAWERVIAVVVQPGFEFNSTSVTGYDCEKARPLARKIEEYEKLVYEAHSTDYQTRKALRDMVENHFAILKVGPWLTFAFREAVYALSYIEEELLTVKRGAVLSDIRAVIERVMCENPKHWKNYYSGSAEEQALARKFSFSDRVRYYWPDSRIQRALETLTSNLSNTAIPLTLISQYLPVQYEAVREGALSPMPEDLILHRITVVLDHYSRACGMDNIK